MIFSTDAMANDHKDQPVQGEAAIVALLAPLAQGFPGAFGLQDDCALLTPEPGTELVLKTDPVAEGVHFLPGTAPEDVAWKALAVNVSDLAAKGATPVGYLMALSFPQAPGHGWMTRFVAGLAAAQARFGCHLMGGDTDRRPGPLTVSITAIGQVPAGCMVRRGTAKAGDALFVSGTIGDAGLGLSLAKDAGLAERWGLTPAQSEALMRRHARPEPRLALGPMLRAHASAAMDVSDGLVKDLERLARASGVAARLEAGAVPLSAAARRLLGQAPERLMGLITAGDDYEILAAVASDRAAAFVAAAAATGIAVTRVGVLGPGPAALQIIGTDGQPLALPAMTGWDHF
jgi:thiamine-monophosphate kinase